MTELKINQTLPWSSSLHPQSSSHQEVIFPFDRFLSLHFNSLINLSKSSLSAHFCLWSTFASPSQLTQVSTTEPCLTWRSEENVTVNKTAETLNQKEMFCFFAYIGVWNIILIATSVNSLWATAPTHIGKVNYNMPHLSVSAVNPSGLIPLQTVHSNGIAYYYILNMTSLHLCNLSGICFDLKVLLFLLFIYKPPLIHYGWYMLYWDILSAKAWMFYEEGNVLKCVSDVKDFEVYKKTWRLDVRVSCHCTFT